MKKTEYMGMFSKAFIICLLNILYPLITVQLLLTDAVSSKNLTVKVNNR